MEKLPNRSFAGCFVRLDSMYILVLYGNCGEERNHEHKSRGNQSVTLVVILEILGKNCNQNSRISEAAPGFLPSLQQPQDLQDGFETLGALNKWKGRQKSCITDSVGEKRNGFVVLQTVIVKHPSKLSWIQKLQMQHCRK